MGEVSALYIFYAIVESLLMVLIVWFAWRWPRLEKAGTAL